jgi:hypothetical protein
MASHNGVRLRPGARLLVHTGNAPERMSEKFYAWAIRLSMIRVAARSIIASDV